MRLDTGEDEQAVGIREPLREQQRFTGRVRPVEPDDDATEGGHAELVGITRG